MRMYDIAVTTIDGKATTLGEYRGQVLLIVNVASQCGFTPQYEGLEVLYRRHRQEGFAVLGFPCDQFGHQEPGTEAEIQSFCTRTYAVTFPMFGKIEVNGRGAHPLYRLLRRSAPGIFGTTAIKWNFTKFLVGRDGKVLERYAPTITPDEIEPDIVRALGMKRVVRSSKG
ncbi:MAG TPA: glutathione peroxidase [Gemmatimonadales bacterium]|nr:glutathione peroxidase [Gemmatimonadales bacterium]